jgi:undecaprenyl-diphosphatase
MSVWSQISKVLRKPLLWVARHELGINLAVGASALGVFVFVKVASEVRAGDATNFDRALLLSLRNPANVSDPVGPQWLEEMGRDFTALGGVGLLTLITLGVVGYLLLIRKPRTALFVAVSISGALALSAALKTVFARPRPALVPHLSHVASLSFPSGHSMLSAAVYLTMATLLARVEPRLFVRAYVMVWALVLVFLVGFSRVYAGVHWPTDVLAGWAAGAAWASLSWLVARALGRRGTLEPTALDAS